MDNKKKSKSDDLIGEKQMKETFNHVIDYIIAKRVGKNGRTEYLVKWEGWTVREATWEPESNFASPQVAEIFEAGLRQQMGITETQSLSAKKKRQSDKARATKSAPKRKNNLSDETMASKIIDKLKNKNQKKKRNGVKAGSEMISAETLFDVDHKIQKVIKSYEKLVGASKRKSSRMSCPSSPPKQLEPVCPKSPSLREQRYKQRQSKSGPSTDKPSTKRSITESFASLESITSLEENKNPIESSIPFDFGEQKRYSNRAKTPTNRKREIKVNNDSNKMISRRTQSMIDSEDQTGDEETPSKKFLNNVRQRYSDKPNLYDQFLSSVIEYHNSNVELNNVLANNDELVDGFFSVLYINREHILNPYFEQSPTVAMTDQQIDERVQLWLDQLNRTLTPDEQVRFWQFIQNKNYEEVVNASPDFFWLKVNHLFKDDEALREGFKTFMPNFCKSIYLKYSNKTLQ